MEFPIKKSHSSILKGFDDSSLPNTKPVDKKRSTELDKIVEKSLVTAKEQLKKRFPK